jgi:putative heme-binding domain-containing protein
LQLPPLGSGNALDYFVDGSGRAHHLAQHQREARPRFRQEFSGAFVSFDGSDDALVGSNLREAFTNLTVFVVAAAKSNKGEFRALCGLSQAGANDYTSGLNFDLGPFATPQIAFVNAEGSGFGGATQLLNGPALTSGHWHVFSLDVGPRTVRLLVDGKAQRSREREPSLIMADELVLGARQYSNTAEPPYIQGFFHGEIAEFVVFNRQLTESERASVEKYLNQKYGFLLNRVPDLQHQAEPLVTVSNPPPVQMLVPGFSVRELPLALNNINNLKYRPDGKLVALGYDGHVYLLSDSDGDGLEDRAQLFWPSNTLRAPIGMALTPPGYPRGQGVFVAAKGKLSLIVDTDGDDRADQEIVVAEGWKELAHGVDALGVALDREGNVYFGLGTASYTEPYLVDKASGMSRYDLKSERGTILKVSPDFQHREIICTGIRFSVALAFNRNGDLFCTDQEGATWLPNGNPFDELLQIQPGRHYGFPPRHPKYLPGVIDEPSVYDYPPQHQSTCGLNFNDGVNGGTVFGPRWWSGDAIVCGYSRGKIWRTKLVKTPAGYVAQTQLLAALSALTVDACPSPQGDLVVSTHGGEPDWGSGPNGQGHLYKISYDQKDLPQPVLAWSAGPSEIEICFDRPLEPASLKGLASRVSISQGKYVSAGDRFESKRPGYAAVYSQLAEPRHAVPVQSIEFTPDFGCLVLHTKPLEAAVNYGVTLARFERPESASGLQQVADVDLALNLNGVLARWQPAVSGLSTSSNQPASTEIYLPHLDLEVAHALTQSSAPHGAFWSKLHNPGTLTLRGQLNLWEMLHPAIQPGSRLDYERPVETVTVSFSANAPFTLKTRSTTLQSQTHDAEQTASVQEQSVRDRWFDFELSLPTGSTAPQLTATWSTADDSRPRALPLRRFYLPWARPSLESPGTNREPPHPELAGGNWLRGKHIFFGETAGCYKCHMVRGAGNRVGPDLSNLVQRDYASVLKDIVQPSAALNPDHLAYNIHLADGEELTAVIQTEARDQITVADATGKSFVVTRDRISSIRPSAVSLMPEGLDKALSAAQLKDLLTFLLTESPLQPAPIEARGEPPLRSPADIEPVLLAAKNSAAISAAPLHIVLCAGPKDHGPGEHDYPLWQKRWASLLGLADNVTVSTAWEWPSVEQWREAHVIVFYSDNPGWNSAHAAELEAFLARGGGAAFIHFAVDGHDFVEALARSIGLAWRGNFSKFRHGALDLALADSAITAGFKQVHLVDESYWALVGSLEGAHTLATAVEDGQPRPLLWTRTQGNGRVFVCIPGHYTWTFDDPVFRLLLLRGISWAAGQPVDRLAELATIGARMPGQ